MELNENTRDKERKRIGERIKEMRLNAGLSQSDCATLCGMKQSSLARIEAGRFCIGFDTLSKIGYHLGAKIDYMPLTKS